MKLQLPLVFVLACLLFSTTSTAQSGPGITFYRVKPEDFSMSKITVDTSSGAVIVADIGKSYFEGNIKGWFTLVYEQKRRIRIIDKKGFDLATVAIPLYRSKKTNSEETLESLKAYTYNLENGKVVETKLDKDDVFKDQLDENHLVKKFTMPAVKEGSIIEYSYTIKSDFLFNIQPWSFQGAYPRMWSEYNVSIPSFFKYVILSQGYFPFEIKTERDEQNTYFVRESANGGIDNDGRMERNTDYKVPSNDKLARWVVKNIPALKEEKFTSSISNHFSRLDFQLAAYDFPNTKYETVMSDWKTISGKLLEDKDFGADLSNANRWISDDIRPVSLNASSKLEAATSIYKYVQHNISNKGTRGIYLSQSLKETFKNKNGYVADINMLLTMILRNQGFEATPVILSTRENGFTSEVYPLLNKFNYVITRVIIDDKPYFLDASQPYLGFAKLPDYVYNGQARIIDPVPSEVYLTTDDISENKVTQVMLNLDEKNPGNWKGFLNTTLGYYESSDIRESILSKGKESFTKKLQQSYTGDFRIDSIELSDFDVYEEPMHVVYNIYIDNNNSDFIYFNPMIREGMTENVFKSQERQYPVEMPFKTNETYLLTIKIPQGYTVEELPKSAKVSLNENESTFEYLVSKTEKEVQLRTTLKFDRTLFAKEDYESLRGYFDYIVKKHAEQIVFKKKP